MDFCENHPRPNYPMRVVKWTFAKSLKIKGHPTTHLPVFSQSANKLYMPGSHTIALKMTLKNIQSIHAKVNEVDKK